MVVAILLGAVLRLGAPSWEAPAGCPEATFVEERVQAYLGGREVEFAASARVAIVEVGFEATIEVAAEGGVNTRTLRADDCVTLADATALVIAIDVDVLAVASSPGVRDVLRPDRPKPTPPEPRPPGPAPAPEPALVAVPETSVPPLSDRSSPPPKRNVGFAVRLDVGIGVLALPRPNLVAALTAAIRWRRWRWELVGAHHFGQPARLDPPNDEAGADVRLWSVGARTRFVPAAGNVEFPISAGVELGDMIGNGVGVANARTLHRLWGAGLLGAAIVVVPHPRIGIWLDPTLVLAFARPGFGVTPRTGQAVVAHQPGVPGFRATLGFEVRIP